jgi:hypothetical protein
MNLNQASIFEYVGVVGYEFAYIWYLLLVTPWAELAWYMQFYRRITSLLHKRLVKTEYDTATN